MTVPVPQSKAQRPNPPRIVMKEVGREVSPGGTTTITAEASYHGMTNDDGRKALAASLGIAEDNLYSLLEELSGVTQCAKGSMSHEKLNYALSILHGIGPVDQVELLLAAQMTVTHLAVMSEASLLRTTNAIKTRDHHERVFNKLARTFAAQVATLKNHRAPPGQQKMVVEHVNVHPGGQAIVGPVERHRRGEHGGGDEN